MLNKEVWEKLFEITSRDTDEAVLQQHCDLAAAIQHVTEKIILLMAKHAKAISGQNNVCLAGGVALNCVANGKLHRSGLFDNMYIQPAAGDAGGAIGAALAANHIYFGRERTVLPDGTCYGQQHTFLGPAYSGLDIMPVIRKYNAVYEKTDNDIERNNRIIEFLQQGKVIGLFQDRMEFGPRALGNRSIIADAANAEMQKKINLKIKFRESFRPFAAVTTQEDVQDYFDFKGASPYMLGVYNLQTKLMNKLPANYAELAPEEKLTIARSALPAITHVDGSCRIQTCNSKSGVN
jgi:carbamoyltransferase